MGQPTTHLLATSRYMSNTSTTTIIQDDDGAPPYDIGEDYMPTIKMDTHDLHTYPDIKFNNCRNDNFTAQGSKQCSHDTTPAFDFDCVANNVKNTDVEDEVNDEVDDIEIIASYCDKRNTPIYRGDHARYHKTCDDSGNYGDDEMSQAIPCVFLATE